MINQKLQTNTKYFEAAGITVQVLSDFPIHENTFHPKFKFFEVAGSGNDNVLINHHFYLPDFLKNPDLYKKKIYSNLQWNIFKAENSWVYKYTPVLPYEPGCPVTAIINLNHTIVDIYTDSINEKDYKSSNFNALTLFNSDQVLFSKLLCDRKGIIIHSNGFNINDKGFLLAGRSGSGKSTLSQMLKQRRFEILCDDRMFVGKKNNSFWIYGNWCHGSIPDVSQASVPLRAVFFLKQSTKNKIDLITDKKIVSQNLIQAMVKPFLSQQDWDVTFSTLIELIQNVKFYILYFDLSGDICNKIITLIEKAERN